MIINVNTLKEFTRKHFRVLPCPDSVIAIFQQIYQKEKLTSSKSTDIAEVGVNWINSIISQTNIAVEDHISNSHLIVKTNLLQTMMLYGFNESVVSMMKELRGIVKRNVFKGVHLIDLTELEKKGIITGRMNLIQKQIFHTNV